MNDCPLLVMGVLQHRLIESVLVALLHVFVHKWVQTQQTVFSGKILIGHQNLDFCKEKRIF